MVMRAYSIPHRVTWQISLTIHAPNQGCCAHGWLFAPHCNERNPQRVKEQARVLEERPLIDRRDLFLPYLYSNSAFLRKYKICNEMRLVMARDNYLEPPFLQNDLKSTAVDL
jgi:hypothetical protein